MKRLFLLVMVMGIFSLLFGCSKKPSPVTEEPEVVVRVEFPKGVKLSGFYMNHSGMQMNPYYVLKTTDSGTYMKITDKCPEDYWIYSGGSAEGLVQPAEYFGYVETVREDEKASLVCLEDEAVIRQLEECIARYGALGWDGYDESKTMPNVMDSGDNYNLYLELSDGTTVKMHGYNTCPSGFRELYQEAVQIFHSYSDDSGYEAIKKAVVKETYDFYMEEKFGVEKTAETLAEKIRGSYMYYPEKEKTKLDNSATEEKEEGFSEEYLIEFRYINHALVAEVNYQRDFNSVYSRHMVELNPVSEHALESTTETIVQLAAREFSGFSMFGEYWDDAVSVELQVVDEGLAYQLTGSDTVYVLERVENVPAMHEEEMLKEYLGQVVDVPLVDIELLDETGILGEWHASTVVDGKQEQSYLSFEEDGLLWFMRKIEGEPVELYRGAYGVTNGNQYPSIYVAAERSGYPYAPVLGIWNRVLLLNDSGTNPVLKLYDSDETMPLLIGGTEEGMLEFSRERNVLAGNKTNWQSAEPGTVLIDYYKATQATVGGAQYVEYVLRKTEAEDAVALEVYRGMEDEEETCMRYVVPEEAVEQSFEIIDRKELHNWNERYDGGGLEGSIVVCRFFDGKGQIRTSTDCMPEDGAEILESIGHVIASYQQEKYRAQEEG